MERRENERLPVRQAPAKAGGASEILPYRVLNVSRSGCYLESREPIGEVECAIVFELPLPAGADSLTLAARVVWKDADPERDPAGCLHYGLRFDPADRVSEMILEAYVEFLRRDLHIAQLEAAWLKLKNVHEKIELLIAYEEKKTASFLH